MSRIIVPDNWGGKPLSGSIERVLQGAPVTPAVNSPVPAPRAASGPLANKQDYIILPGRDHGNYSYPDLLVAKGRTHPNKMWVDAWADLKDEGAFMLTIRQYADFLNMLRVGTNVYDGNGQRLPSGEVDRIYRDITEVRNPWRAEWLDAKFDWVSVGKTLGIAYKIQFQITYHSLDSMGTLKEIVEPVGDCLMSDRTPGINLEFWMQNATPQGLPFENTEAGQGYYWHPRDARVAGFVAYSDWACLYCDGDPQLSYSVLGVRPVRAKI